MTPEMAESIIKVLLIRRGGFEVIERHEIAQAKKLTLVTEMRDGELRLRFKNGATTDGSG